MSGFVQTNQPVNLPDANATISASDTGKIHFVNTVTGIELTQPAVAPGLHYHFINKAPGALGGNVIVKAL